jgi:hypothetical protein
MPDDTKQLVPVDPTLMQTPGLLKRLTQAVTYALRGGFFSPDIPIKGSHPETAGRRFDYRPGYNLQIKPPRDSGLDPQMLRNFAKVYDLLRIILETRKDQVCGFDWSIVPTDEDLKVKPDDETMATCDKIAEFFRHPATEMDWNAWLRAILEDCFVLDGICIWPTYTGKALDKLEIIDPATIQIVIDESGRTPNPPYPAYRQVLKGIPANEYRKGELFYFIRNPMSHSVLGYSHVEQIIMTIMIGLNREKTQFNYFTEGNIPEAICGVPETWTMEHIAQFQTYWDTLLSGNLEKRAGHMHFVPADASKIQMLRKEESTLKGEFDEWLARIICYTFSVTPIPFIKQTNRAVAESMASVAKEEGLLPLLHFLRRVMNTLITDALKIEGFEFKWNLREDTDPKVQSEIDVEEVEHGIVSIDDIRKRKGLEALGVPPMIWTTAYGPVPVSMFIDGTAPGLIPPQPTQQFDENGDPMEPPPPNGKKPPNGAAKPGDKKPDKQEASKRIAAPFRKHYGEATQALAKYSHSRGDRAPRFPGKGQGSGRA